MTRDEIMAVTCPTCWAKAGHSCVTYMWRAKVLNSYTVPHASRKASAVADAIIHFAPPAPPGDKG